jgi:hypothetical protein
MISFKAFLYLEDVNVRLVCWLLTLHLVIITHMLLRCSEVFFFSILEGNWSSSKCWPRVFQSHCWYRFYKEQWVDIFYFIWLIFIFSFLFYNCVDVHNLPFFRCNVIPKKMPASHWAWAKSIWTSYIYHWKNIAFLWWG